MLKLRFDYGHILDIIANYIMSVNKKHKEWENHDERL